MRWGFYACPAPLSIDPWLGGLSEFRVKASPPDSDAFETLSLDGRGQG